MDTICGLYIQLLKKNKKNNCTDNKIYVHLYKYTTNVISIKFVQMYGTYKGLKITIQKLQMIWLLFNTIWVFYF